MIHLYLMLLLAAMGNPVKFKEAPLVPALPSNGKISSITYTVKVLTDEQMVVEDSVVIEYNNQGLMEKQTHFTSKGVSYSKYIYNSKKQRVAAVEHYPGITEENYTFTYDAKGNQLQYSIYEGEKLRFTEECEYDAHGNRVLLRHKSGRGKPDEAYYANDYEANIITITNNKHDPKVNFVKFYFDDKGYQVKRENYRMGRLERTYTYSYDDKGYLVSKIEEIAHNNHITNQAYVNTYDGKSNITRVDCYKRGELVEIHQYSIAYKK